MTVSEVRCTSAVLDELLAMSAAWEAESSCYGYVRNDASDIAGNRVFLACDGERTVGYLFGHGYRSENMRSIMPEGSTCFEVEELYVVPSMRSQGVGKQLMDEVGNIVGSEYDYLTLTTATKNWRAILHFYIEEVGMGFWSARLFKKILK